MPLWGMAYKSIQSHWLADYEQVTTVEDHIVDGGFGSWLLESTAAGEVSTPIHIRALDSVVLGLVGSQRALTERGGLG